MEVTVGQVTVKIGKGLVSMGQCADFHENLVDALSYLHFYHNICYRTQVFPYLVSEQLRTSASPHVCQKVTVWQEGAGVHGCCL